MVTVPADGLTMLGARTSADTVMTMVGSLTYIRSAFEGKIAGQSVVRRLMIEKYCPIFPGNCSFVHSN